MQAKVSVIIPVYNTAPYLRKALDSICNQTLKELEIIIIDDGSTDESSLIINEYAQKDSRIHIYQQPNQGQGVARNLGLSHASGEHIYFMDSDDILQNNALEICYNKCVNNQLDFVLFDAELLTEVEDAYIPDYNRKGMIDTQIWNGIDLLKHELKHSLFRTPVWLYFVRSSFLKESFDNFLPQSYAEDHLFALGIHLHAKRVCYIPNNFFKRRVRYGSSMTQKFTLYNIECYMNVFSSVKELINKNTAYKDVLNQYLYDTLNAVVWTSHRLSFIEKIKTCYYFYNNKLSHYITFRNWFVFWFKLSKN